MIPRIRVLDRRLQDNATALNSMQEWISQGRDRIACLPDPWAMRRYGVPYSAMTRMTIWGPFGWNHPMLPDEATREGDLSSNNSSHPTLKPRKTRMVSSTASVRSSASPPNRASTPITR